MIDEREKLIAEMARAIFAVVVREAEFVPPNGDWKYCIKDAKAALSVAERALSEKHARIAEKYLPTTSDPSSTPRALSALEIAAAIRASVGKSETNNQKDG